jgi:hypothetical protein
MLSKVRLFIEEEEFKDKLKMHYRLTEKRTEVLMNRIDGKKIQEIAEILISQKH